MPCVPCARASVPGQTLPTFNVNLPSSSFKVLQPRHHICCPAHGQLPNAAQRSEISGQQPEDNQEATAFLASVIGDTADRSPTKLSERAQQQIQRLRSLRSTPIHAGGPHAVRSGHSSVPERGFAKHRKSTNVPQQSAVVEPDRLPSKAELRGTLGTVSRKVYEQVTQSRNRLSVRLSAANKHNKQLHKAVEARNKDMATVHECLTRVMAEVNALDRVAQTAAVSAQFGTDKSETVAKMGSMMERMHLLQEVVQAHVGQLDKVTHREVPVVWFGIAQQVRLMGDFDGWTQGFSLSANDIYDGTFTKFQATLSLPPGLYQVKFVVDGQWRTAPDWPTVDTQHGTNNLLQVG